jgi:hypothetical protein
MQFGNIANTNRQWDQEIIVDILMACLVLHNMIIEDEYNLNLEPSFDVGKNITFKRGFLFEDYVESVIQIENYNFHYNLQNDFIEHLWQLKGNN